MSRTTRRSAAPLRLLCSVVLALACGFTRSQTGYLSESQIKAGYLYNFAKYVEWPAEAFANQDAAFVVCTVGRDDFGEALASIEGRIVHGRALHVRRRVAIEQLAGCQLAYLAESEESRALRSVQAAGAAVLTVSEIGGFVDIGGGIGLVHSDERLLFEVNLGALDRANLKASSQLLKLARNVVAARRN